MTWLEALLYFSLVATLIWIVKQVFNYLGSRQLKFHEIEKEIRNALAEQKLHLCGMKDMLQGFQTDLSLMQKELGEFEKNLGSDEVSKMTNRIGFLETAVGIRRISSLQTPKKEASDH